MKTWLPQRTLLIVVGLSALLAGPAFAAFGDNPEPAASALSSDSAAGSALPPGTYPSSPADSDKKTKEKETEKQPSKPAKPSDRQQKETQQKPRSGS